MSIEPLEVRQALFHLRDGLFQATRQWESLPDPLFNLGGVHSEKYIRFGFSDVLEILSQTKVILGVWGPTLGEAPIVECALIFVLGLQEVISHCNAILRRSRDSSPHFESQPLSCANAHVTDVYCEASVAPPTLSAGHARTCVRRAQNLVT